MTAPLFDTLASGTVLIAAGQRLCRHLAQQYARECRARGLAAWETPAVLTLGAWLSRLWEEVVDRGVDARLLLSIAQESVLWERVIAESDPGAQLLSVTATANLARDAWSLLHAWQLPRSEVARAAHEDVQAFVAWATSYEEICRVRRWLDGARLLEALTELAISNRLPVPARVVLAGFDEFTPQQQRFVDALRVSSCEVVSLQARELPARAARRAPASSEDEILAAACWARSRLEADPAARIGVLAPDLSAQNRAIRRIFDDVLLAESILPGREEMARPYNVSLGEPLARQPMIVAAFAILELAQDSLPFARLSELLRSPYLAGAEAEMTPRALVDAGLRRVGEVRISIPLLTRVVDAAGGSCPILNQRLARFRATSAGLKRVRSPLAPSVWIDVIAALLADFGWPGDRARSSVEHQLIEAWRELLGEFGALDAVAPAMRYAEAIARLRRMAAEALFQRETPETPVQILGVLEASGLEFDALWVMGLHDEVWPSSPRPNPLLPVALQRAHGVPHASAERELEFCTRVTQRLLASAPEVVVSHPRRDEDRDLRPSPLIRDLPEPVAETPSQLSRSPPMFRDLIHKQSRRESMVDELAPPLQPGTVVDGGTGLLRAQSACPFRGFAEYRLGAREQREPESGLSAADRGTLVHDVLAQVWRELQSHSGLIALSGETLRSRVLELAADEVKKLQRRRPETVTDRMAALERERLTALALEWLEIEKARTPFTVRREETTTPLALAGLVTRMRMDRVDELANGDLAVIDYKTGQARVGDWFGERPAEPQLPLYALYGVPRERVGAILYANLRRGESAFLGLARSAGIAPGMATYGESKFAATQGSWEALLAGWENTLTALADEHRAGLARVSPRDRKACERCHLHALCRIHERRARLGGVDDEQGGEDGPHD